MTHSPTKHRAAVNYQTQAGNSSPLREGKRERERDPRTYACVRAHGCVVMRCLTCSLPSAHPVVSVHRCLHPGLTFSLSSEMKLATITLLMEACVFQWGRGQSSSTAPASPLRLWSSAMLILHHLSLIMQPYCFYSTSQLTWSLYCVAALLSRPRWRTVDQLVPIKWKCRHDFYCFKWAITVNMHRYIRRIQLDQTSVCVEHVFTPLNTPVSQSHRWKSNRRPLKLYLRWSQCSHSVLHYSWVLYRFDGSNEIIATDKNMEY